MWPETSAGAQGCAVKTARMVCALARISPCQSWPARGRATSPSSGNQVLVRAPGASKTIDHAVRDITAEPAPWDIVADAVGTLTFACALPILSEGGRYLSIAGGLGERLARPRGSRCSIGGPAWP